MDSLLEAATNVESISLEELALLHDTDVFLQTTPHGNTCAST
jgi:hypothetical protein